MLDYQAAVVSFEAVQRASPNGSAAVAIQGAEIVQLPAVAPRGIFRPTSSVGF